MPCPECKMEAEIQCDNKCGSYTCYRHGEYHENDNGNFERGHSERCGNFILMRNYWQKKEQERKKQEARDEEKYRC